MVSVAGVRWLFFFFFFGLNVQSDNTQKCDGMTRQSPMEEREFGTGNGFRLLLSSYAFYYRFIYTSSRSLSFFDICYTGHSLL